MIQPERRGSPDGTMLTSFIILLLTLGIVINHASEIATFVLPDRFLFDCSTLPPKQQEIVRNGGLPAIGIWKKCK
jgi:hypothetical protein